MTVLNTADWLLSCSTPSSATSMREPGTVHVCVVCPHDCCVTSLSVCSGLLLCSLNSVLMGFPLTSSIFSLPFLKGFSHSQKTVRKLLQAVILQCSESHLMSKENLTRL